MNLSSPVNATGNEWINSILKRAKPIESESVEDSLISTLIHIIYQQNDSPSIRRLKLAAAFDLVVSAEYYRSVAHASWLYCPEADTPFLFYPYTNSCPQCALQDKFIFHQANKPKSGAIGAATSRLLARFLHHLFAYNQTDIKILKGTEPVDIIFVDDSTHPITIMFVEIKAAPLVTLPLATQSQTLTVEQNNQTIEASHRVSDHAYLLGSLLNIFVPVRSGKNWEGLFYPLGSKVDNQNRLWAYHGLIGLLRKNPAFLGDYFEFWQSALDSYTQKTQDSVFWLTNACGQPNPRPDDWPRRRRASGFESISDSKTSVGMDRTDDLKKATYQVLKMGAEGRPTTDYDYKVGLISNLHAVRHFDAYMDSLKDIVWTRDETGNVRCVADFPPETKLFNLFDGIISITNALTRDEWVQRVFDF